MRGMNILAGMRPEARGRTMAGIGEALLLAGMLVRQPSDTACVCSRLAAARLLWPGLYRLFGSRKAQMAMSRRNLPRL